jgi:hypothetical protein
MVMYAICTPKQLKGQQYSFAAKYWENSEILNERVGLRENGH